MTALRERLAQMGENIGSQEKVVEVPIDVAAALVAVAEAARLTRAANAGGNFDDVVATGKVLDGALDALATALGVSR